MEPKPETSTALVCGTARSRGWHRQPAAATAAATIMGALAIVAAFGAVTATTAPSPSPSQQEVDGLRKEIARLHAETAELRARCSDTAGGVGRPGLAGGDGRRTALNDEVRPKWRRRQQSSEGGGGSCVMPNDITGYDIASPPSLGFPGLGLPDLGLPPLGVATTAQLGGATCAAGFVGAASVECAAESGGGGPVTDTTSLAGLGSGS